MNESFWNRSKLFVCVVQILPLFWILQSLSLLLFSSPNKTKTGANFARGKKREMNFLWQWHLKYVALCGEIVEQQSNRHFYFHLLLSIGLKGISKRSTDFPSHGIEFNGHRCVSACSWKTLFKNKEKIILPEFACRFISKYKVTLYKLPSRWSDSEVDGYQINVFKRNYCSFGFHTHGKDLPI